MTRKEAITYINSHPEFYLTPDNNTKSGRLISGHPFYICPCCGSGSGKNGTGLTTKDGIHFTCWNSSCDGDIRCSDIISIIQNASGNQSFNETIRIACKIYNISIDDSNHYNYDFTKSNHKNINGNKALLHTSQNCTNNTSQLTDYTSYYHECELRLSKCDYMQKRGISFNTCKKYHIGYDPSWISPAAMANGRKPFPSKRIIIPVNAFSYIARDIRSDSETPEQAKAYRKMKVGKSTLFNTAALTSLGSQPLFIVEGEIDALSVIEATGGYPFVIGLGSTSNYRQLTSLLTTNQISTAILCLDNDTAGLLTSFKISRILSDNNIPYSTYNISGQWNDPNEALMKSPDEFQSSLRQIIQQTAC